MANECMNTVIFYAVSEEQKKGLNKFRKAVESCYCTNKPSGENSLIQIFNKNGISFNDISIRCSVLYSDFGDGYVALECISAWNPPYEAYSRLAKYYGISFVLQAEEPGFSIYINTDMNKEYLTTEYKVYLAKRPEDHSLDDLFNNAGEETEFYFDSKEELKEWFRDYSSIQVKTVEELKKYLHNECVYIYEFENPYQYSK